MRFVSGKGAYILALLENILLKGLHQAMNVKMGHIDHKGRATVLVVCNGRYYGGGFQPVPEAMPDDGILDALLIPALSWPVFLRHVGQYAKGRYKECLKYIWPYHGDHILVTAPKEIIVVVDGEELRGTHFEIRRSEKKVNFFYPAYASYKKHEAVCCEETAV